MPSQLLADPHKQILTATAPMRGIDGLTESTNMQLARLIELAFREALREALWNKLGQRQIHALLHHSLTDVLLATGNVSGVF